MGHENRNYENTFERNDEPYLTWILNDSLYIYSSCFIIEFLVKNLLQAPHKNFSQVPHKTQNISFSSSGLLVIFLLLQRTQTFVTYFSEHVIDCTWTFLQIVTRVFSCQDFITKFIFLTIHSTPFIENPQLVILTNKNKLEQNVVCFCSTIECSFKIVQ